MFYIKSMFLLLVSLMMGSSTDRYPESPGGEDSVLTLTIQPNREFQTIHSFGASDAWSTQFVGKNWPLEKREKIADLLFSTETNADGQPEGIGLSTWRFNIGAGSARQGEDSGIGDPWRRAESFLTDDSTYDWSRQAGQQWFMQAAKERGVKQFIGFVNSPPVLLTRNGKAYGDGGSNANIAPGHYEAFADYLARIAEYFKKEGTPFDYISPVNEPQWDWGKDNGQEGSPWQNDEISAFLPELDKKIRSYDLETQIEITEAGHINFLNRGKPDERGQQVEYFFGPNSKVKDLQSLAPKIAAHSYFSTWPVDTMVLHREQLRNKIQQTGESLEYWMSEYCILANNEQIKGGGRDLGMDPALYVARLMHYDLTIPNAASWQWWLAVSPYDFKDGLVYIDKDMNDGQVRDSKLLWAVGNYSRFIRPGSVRIGLSRSDQGTPVENASGLMASAYRDRTGKSISVVIVNYSRDEKSIQLDMKSEMADMPEAFTPYVTSEQFNLEPRQTVGMDELVKIPPRSVVTVTGTME